MYMHAPRFCTDLSSNHNLSLTRAWSLVLQDFMTAVQLPATVWIQIIEDVGDCDQSALLPILLVNKQWKVRCDVQIYDEGR
jgi:hypothetical protein